MTQAKQPDRPYLNSVKSIRGSTRARLRLAILLGAVGLAVAAQANAGCKIGSPQQTPVAKSVANSHFLPAAYRTSEKESATFMPVWDFDFDPSIVGLWEFEVRASIDEGPFHKGDLIDWGLATWHGDGTEIQFSAGRPYDAGDICMGVWKPQGHHKYHLNHIALGKDLGTGATFDGLTNIVADVTVDPTGDKFTGQYQIIQYLGNPANGTEFDQTNEQYRFIATVAAKRVKP